MDQMLVRRLREDVADILARQRREDAASGIAPMSAEDERQFARAVIARTLETYARSEMTAGRTPPGIDDEQELSEGIHAALFGVGRLQPLLRRPAKFGEFILRDHHADREPVAQGDPPAPARL